MARVGAYTFPQHFQHKRHCEAVLRKRERIAMYQAILKEWEDSGDPDTDYMRDLRARLRSAETQLRAMKP